MGSVILGALLPILPQLLCTNDTVCQFPFDVLTTEAEAEK